MNDLFRELYFGFIAILMLSELVASDLYSLFFLDALPGAGALMVLWATRHQEAARLGYYGVWLTVFGMLMYGFYQFWFATVRLGDLQIYIQAVGVVYALFGLVAWFVAGNLRERPNDVY